MLGRSLWDRVPGNLRLGMVPVLTTALLVQSGTQTATVLSCLSQGALFCKRPSGDLSVIDIQGILILVNFAVVFWFAYRALGEAVAKSGQISLDVKVIGLGTAFLSSLEIYGYALKNAVPERLVFVLPIVFFVFVVPFVLLRKAAFGEPSDDDRDVTRQAYSALRLVVVALVVCVAVTLAGSLYYVLLNEGLHFGTAVMFKPLVTREAWVFNPAVLGLGWLAALCISVRSDGSKTNVMTLDVTPAGLTALLIVPLLINAAIAVVMISDGNIASAPALIPQNWQLSLAKAALGFGVTLVFMIAFFASRWAGFGTAGGMFAGAVAFMAAGAVGGLAAASVRAAFGNSSAFGVSVIIHIGGFVLAYFAGLLAWRFVQRSFSDLTMGHQIAFRPSTLTEN
ncbi:hypothetical protein RFM99_25710 [Mesorhizobium sp. VK4C]|uniref:hypothetical protein n=1 Tax=Mesorhizobium captivum TaxID=3072319 RepID=UPI002A24E8B0|nr:hypothetical protein [Mesorhizobium sp. VK4C]MDX8501798.1 hypothetical protein [Mesorhizobium sp. VK4C]